MAAVAAKRRHWGYLVWIVAGLVIAIPEITAAFDGNALPFTTISGMTGHLERHWNWVELIVVALIVFAVFSIVRVPPRTAAAADDAGARRTAGGRLTVRPRDDIDPATKSFDDDDAPAVFAVAAVASFALIALGTWAAVQWWDDERHFHPAYVLYGSIALLWLVVPGLVAFFGGKDVPFPTLFRSVVNLEDRLKKRSPLLAALVTYVLLAGLVILLLHLTFYPYPNITHILNPNG